VRKLSIPFLALGLITAGSTARHIDAQAAQKIVDKTPPSYDMKPQSLLDLEDLQKKFTSLAEAIPADQYTWRPAPDVRSIAEVFLHVAGTNLQYASVLATVPAPPQLPKGYEQSTTEKARIIAQLNQSFDFAHAAIEQMTNIDFKKPMTQFGPDANAGDIVYLIVTHTHEHLGQAIAYARIKGVVPPWTAVAQVPQQKTSQN